MYFTYNMLIDIHAHLTHEVYKEKLDFVISNAKNNNIGIIVCSGVNHATNVESLRLAKKYDIVKCSLGLYPIDLLGLGSDESGLSRDTEKLDLEKELEFIKQHLDEIIAIGEIGMDFKMDAEHHEQQRKNFKKIVEFCKFVGKPMILHTRKAERDVLEVLEECDVEPDKVVLHCFSGKKKLVQKAIDKGYNFSIPVSVLKTEHFQMMVKMIPLKQILTETDSPWLGLRNEEYNQSANVKFTVEKIAEILELSVEEIEKQVEENYKRVFD